MKLKNIDVTAELKKAEELLAAQKDKITPEVLALIQLLMMIIKLMVNFFGANSKNSGKPPSQDPHRKKGKKEKTGKKSGGQKGHIGKNLEMVDNPDEIVKLIVNPDILPKNTTFTELPSQKRQEFNVKIDVFVTEYQAQVLVDRLGNKYVAEFPKGIDSSVQYGPSVRGLAVYLSNYQMLPFERMQDLFKHQMGLPISTGTLVNMNAQASQLLLKFEQAVKLALIQSPLIHHDETGINIAGKTYWLHSSSNDLWTHFYPHSKRGSDGMDEIGILPNFSGIIVHDNWASYFIYDCIHALCNAHHIRELNRAAEDDGQLWAKEMIELLISIKKEVEESEEQKLSLDRAKERTREYDVLLEKAEEQCPPPPPEPPPRDVQKKKRGRQNKSRSRNLLERLKERKMATLLFMENEIVPFTNNQAERDLRMTKVQQKISGCFRGLQSAKDFCRIRSFISTCMKQKEDVSLALTNLFRGKLPDFVQADILAIPETNLPSNSEPQTTESRRRARGLNNWGR